VRPELQDIVDQAARVMRAPITLEDRETRLIAFSAQQADIDAVRQNSILRRRSDKQVSAWFEQFGIATAEVPVRTPADASLSVRSRICLPARWRGVTYGYLWVLDETSDVDAPAVLEAAGLAEHAGAYLAQQSRRRENEAFALTDLLSGDPETSQDALTRITDGGYIRRGEPVAAIVVGIWAPGAPDSIPLNLWQLSHTVLATPGTNSITLLVPLTDPTDLKPARAVAERTLELYAERVPARWSDYLVAGIGGGRAAAIQARGSWQEASLAARIASAVPASRPIAEWPELGVYRLLAADTYCDLADLAVDSSVRRLLAHDDPDLRLTVSTYLDLAGSAGKAAAALHIHRQTLYYRLAKVEQLTGLDLRNGGHRLRLQLSLMLAPILDRSHG
jgi:sugar diacid utilization regulator